ncbi:uncharacterized protein [Temnothorax longispinosus]|uniref:uncharacterized protein n=1 Tax=Temnothorax longispinosus TaxID=300112 RepID=UPI003A9A4EC3
MYANNKAYIKEGTRLSRPLIPTKGLRQGCSLSPTLFNIYLEAVLKKWKADCCGMGIPVGQTTLFTLSFADDQAVFSQDSYDMKFMLKRLYQHYEQWGLCVNTKKTEYMVVNSVARFSIHITEAQEVGQVDAFKYLGTVITKDERIGATNIKSRIEQSRKVLGCLNSVWWDKNISARAKKHIGRSMVEAVLCYGCEVWSLNADTRRRINAVEMDYLRRGAGVSRLSRVKNEEVRNRMEAEKTIIERIEKRQLCWFGHLMRMSEDRWPQRLYKWTPPGTRKRERPRRSWNEGMGDAMRARRLSEEDTQDRRGWRLGTGKRPQAV